MRQARGRQAACQSVPDRLRTHALPTTTWDSLDGFEVVLATPGPPHRNLRRNLRRYGVYVALNNALFWMPLFFLYFSSRMPLNAR